MPARVLGAPVLPAAGVVSLAVLGIASFHQIGLWRDNSTLWRHAKESTRDNSLVHRALGSQLIADGKLSEGIEELQTALRMGPVPASTYCDLASALERTGRSDEAIEQYRAALAIDDHLPEAHSNLGILLFKRRHFEEARQQYARALEIDPSLSQAAVNLAFACLTLRDYPAAIENARRALKLNAASPTACQVCIALALRGEGRLDEAIGELQRVVESAPDDQVARQELARTLTMKRSSMDGASRAPQ
jgi:tetratricopeptide (TPR) repeat protein